MSAGHPPRQELLITDRLGVLIRLMKAELGALPDRVSTRCLDIRESSVKGRNETKRPGQVPGID